MLQRNVGPIRRLMQRAAALPVLTAVNASVLPPLDRFVYRITRGRAMVSSVLAGLPVVLLTVVGARSGEPRTVPVLGFPLGGDLVVVASNWGRPRHPAWYHNLRACPDATVTVHGQATPVVARETHGTERERLWESARSVYPGLAAYSRRAADRRIPVVVLHRRR